MRILVVSDTHGDASALRSAIMAQPKAELVIHLGDGEREFMDLRASFPEKMFISVCGNCDFGSQLPVMEEITLEGIKIFYTHGHFYNVKFGDCELISAARDRKANVVLYGHTHVKDNRYEDGLYILNPGSLHGYGASYGTVDITKAGIVTNIIDL